MKTNRMYVVLAATCLLGNCKPNELMNDSIKPHPTGERLAAQSAPVKQWDRTYGGGTKTVRTNTSQYNLGDDELETVLPLADGGMILAGSSDSPKGRDKTTDGFGGYDYWLVNVDQNGTKRGTQTVGGSGDDKLCAILPTADGGYLLGGTSNSPKTPADPLGLAIPYKRADSRGDDFWIIKLNAMGAKEWDRTIGGTGSERLYTMVATPDGGYLLGGSSNSPADQHFNPNWSGELGTAGSNDFCITKIDAQGVPQWTKLYGTADSEELKSIVPAQDGGFLLAGELNASTGWFVKIDATGNRLWSKDGLKNSGTVFRVESAVASADGGFLIGCISNAPMGFDKSQNSKGRQDYWIVKLDGWGGKIWDKTIGTSSADFFTCLTAAPDGGYLLGGATNGTINGDKTESSRGSGDYWFMKVDDQGNILWDKTLGGPNNDILSKIALMADGGIIAAGYSNSFSSGDKTADSDAYNDYWVVKLK